MNKPITEMTLEEKATTAMTHAVRKAQERQWRLGLGVWVWKDGRVVNLPPPPHLAIARPENNGQPPRPSP